MIDFRQQEWVFKPSGIAKLQHVHRRLAAVVGKMDSPIRGLGKALLQRFFEKVGIHPQDEKMRVEHGPVTCYDFDVRMLGVIQQPGPQLISWRLEDDR